MPYLKTYLSVLLCSLAFITLYAQEIPYTKTALDLNEEPHASRYIRQQVEVEDGSFIVFCDNALPPAHRSVVSYFDGQNLEDFFSTNIPVEISGTGDGRLFVNKAGLTSLDTIDLLLIDHAAGTIDSVLSFINYYPLADFFFQDDQLFVYHTTTGLVAITLAGDTTVIDPPLVESTCIGCIPKFTVHQPFSDRVLFTKDSSTYVTDGTVQGTAIFYEGWFETPIYLGSQLLQFHREDGLLAYDEMNNQWISLTNQFAESEVFGDFRFIRNGQLYFLASSATTGLEIFKTDGTEAGTEIAFELVPGAADGVVSSGNFRPSVMGERMLITRADPSSVRDLFVTDGTPEGTSLMYSSTEDQPDTRILSFRFFHFQGNTTSLLATAHYDDTALGFTYALTRFNPAEGESAETILESEPVNPGVFNDIYSVNDRCILEWPATNGDHELAAYYSYGPMGSTDSVHLGHYPSRTINTFSAHDRIYLSFFEENNSPDQISWYSTDGAGEQLVPAFSTYRRDISCSTATDDLIFFEQGGIQYAYVFKKNEGTIIYRIGEDGTATVANNQEFTDGIDINWVSGYDGKLFFGVRTEEGTDIYSSDGTNTGSRLLLNIERDNHTSQGIGTLGDKSYFWASNHDAPELIEFGPGEDDYRLLTGVNDLLAGSSAPSSDISYTKPVMNGNFIYFLRSAEGNIFGFSDTVQLVRYDLTTEQAEIIFVDSSPDDQGSLTHISKELLLEKNDTLFFTYSYAFDDYKNYSLPLIVDDPAPILLAHVNAGASRLIASDSAVYLVKLDNEVISLKKAGLPDAEELLFPEVPVAIVELPNQILVQTYRGGLHVVDRSTNAITVILENSTEIRGLHLLPDGNEALFVTSMSEVYLTDGTVLGTYSLGTLELGGSDFSWWSRYDGVQNFGRYVAIMGKGGTLNIIDPANGRIQPVPLYSQYDSDFIQMAVVGNRLYFYDYEFTVGQEIFYLTISEEDFLRGSAYQDDNANGVRDFNEPPLRGVRITNGTGGQAYTNTDGEFTLPANAGSDYSVSSDPLNCFEPTGSTIYDLTFSPNSTYDITFGFRPTAGVAGVRVNTDASPLRCGFTVPVWVTVTNDGCQTVTGTLAVAIPDGASYDSAETEPVNITADSVFFEFGTLAVGTQISFRLLLTMPDEEQAGEPVSIVSVATASLGLDEVRIGSDTYTENLRCAIDPNDKQVSPSRQEPSGSNYTQTDETLRYRIRFQNTGNDTAFTVRIEDWLSTDLDWETFKPLSSSHSFTANVNESGLAVFLFENILLPDSMTNQTLSNGFVTFEIRARRGLNDFSTVSNTAGIFFDFNQPVITNTVTSTFVEFLDADDDGFNFYAECDETNPDINPAAEEIPGNDIDENCDGILSGTQDVSLLDRLSVYPNPTDGWLQITYDRSDLLHGELYEATGRQLQTFSFRNTHRLDLAHLASGIYLVRLYDSAQGNALHRIIVR